MKRIFCCLKGGNSSNAPQGPRQPTQDPLRPPQQQPEGGNSSNAPQGPRQPPQDPLRPPQGPPQQQPEGGNSSNTPQGPRQPPQQQPERVNNENEEVNYDDEPYGNNELLNNIWRATLGRPETRDPNAIPFPTSPPLPANCGQSFRWHEIVDATLNLREEFILGRGNFGVVYRCHFSRTNQDGAVKVQKPQNVNPTGHLEFLAEVTTLHAADHPNVIRLLGRCYGRFNRAIVYELMPNGSLEQQLSARVLDWDTRMRIALGVAEGLDYLHQGLKTIHRDVKAENILLDKDFVPKLTDFGLATKVVEDKNRVEQETEIIPMKGTRGYIAPEAEGLALVSTKSDVYSYGVFLLVLLTGWKAFDGKRPGNTMKLTDWLMPVWTREEYTPLVVDVKLGNKFSVQGLNSIIATARLCINAQALARPNMRVVVARVREAAAFPVQNNLPVTKRRSI